MTLKHEKIRFRRGEIAGLHTYPSAADQPKGHVRLRRVYGFGRLVSIAAIAIAGLCVLLIAAVFAIGSFGFSSERLRDEAQAAISRLAGQPLETKLGPARISLDQARLVALDLKSVEIGTADGRTPHIRAGSLRFGLHVMPLLSGRIELGSAALSDAEIDLSAWRGGAGGGDWRKALGGEDGMVDADELLAAAFGEVHAALDSISPSGAGSFRLDNVDLRLPEGLPVSTVHVASASVVKDRGGRLKIKGELDADGQRVTVDGEASRPDAGHEGAAFALKLVSTPAGEPVPQAERADPDGPYFWPGSFELALTGDQAANAGKGEIGAQARFSGTQLKFRRSGTVEARGAARLVVAGGSGKIELSRLEVDTGRSRLVFSGAVGPQPGDGKDEPAPLYRFELVSNNSVLAPVDANEPPLRAIIRVSGHISDDWQRIVASELALRTDQGDVIGSASLMLAGSQTPAVGLAIAVPKLPVSYAKSLWPWFAAPGAREWALANVFGGMVENSRLVLDARPGSLGEGKRLSADEISGHFEVSGARFDVTGTIPPVRDAVGAIDFKGTDVDIALASGTVFMPSGRTLAARDGTFRIADAHLHPLIGDLDIEIEGKAGAVVEMGSYDPIDMERFIDLDPASLAGDVTGRVAARIPLEREAGLKHLNWQVDLAYTGLSIDKPFEGQLVTEAKGTISARPDRAVIQASAKLNGVPAEISLNEPLQGEAKRSLTARLHFDNAARDKLLPGLSSVVSGPFTVDLEALGEGRQKVSVDLGGAVLSLPWVGWSKGAGVAARAGFVLSSADGITRLSDFRLDGAGFGAAGDITVDGDGLSAARFSRVALNRGDDAHASIERRRGGYTISVGGKSLDARPFIRRFGDLTGATPAKTSDSGPDVSLDARLDEVGGFHDEVLRDVKLAYSAAGTTVGGIRASAATRTGARVTVVDATAGSGRKVEAQASDIGAVLRFLDVYENLHGGTATLSLSGAVDGPLAGQVDIRNFAIVNEARLQSIVSKPPPGDGRSLNEAVRRDLDVSQSKFERGFARIEKGDGYLSVSDGVVRGPTIGSTFQGTVFDRNGNMAITGTFMPAYGLNRLFGEIPLLGQILGNGRDRGLIGITFKLSGKTSQPQLAVNPLSIVAPGIFRSIFEYR